MSRSSSVRLRLGLFGFVAAIATLAFGGSAGAQITVGQIAPSLMVVNSGCSAGSGYNEVQTKVAAGTSYQVPVAGVLTSWSTFPKEGGSLGLGVYRPVAGQYLLLAADGRTIAPGAVNTFPVAIPVQAGDLLGLVVPPSAGASCAFATGDPADELIYKSGNAPVGSTIAFPPENTEGLVRLNVSATLLPPPTIASISPASGSIKGVTTTIAGANFAGVSAVSFGGVPAKSFTVDSEGQITATAPASKKLSKVPVSVTTVAGVATSATTYAYEGCKVPKLKDRKLKASKKVARNADCK
ncbi:MAG TPA: IPT/TIG domain-containing protein, partial [Solirubrobacterales bacterium]|nr:IPT/TIG domain-containing protein [Solirubrobacterales bacterium]